MKDPELIKWLLVLMPVIVTIVIFALRAHNSRDK